MLVRDKNTTADELDPGFGPCAVCERPSALMLHTSEGRVPMCAGPCSEPVVAAAESERPAIIRRLRALLEPKPRPSAPTDPSFTLPGDAH